MAARTFIGGPADGRTIHLNYCPGIVRFFDFKVEDVNQASIASPDEMRMTRYIYTVLPDKPVYFYRSEKLTYEQACLGLQHRMKG